MAITVNASEVDDNEGLLEFVELLQNVKVEQPGALLNHSSMLDAEGKRIRF